MAKSKLKKTQIVKKTVTDSIPKTEKKLKRKKKTKRSKAESSGSESESDPQTKLLTLLEPFSKEQLVTLVTDLAVAHSSLFAHVKSVADQDISHRKIFIHGLGWDATSQSVEEAYGVFGEIENHHVVTDHTTGKCKGYAFVTYKNRKSAKKVLKNPKVIVGNRTSSCQLASGGPPPAGSAGIISQQHFTADFPQRKIYVGNVPANTSAERLRGFFEKFGEIESGPKGFDPVTGKFKGYAIFVFKTLEGAKKVLEEPYKMFEGNQLQCRKANNDTKNKLLGGEASITTALQPVQPQMLAAVAAAQQAQNIALLGQQAAAAGIVNPLYGSDMITNPNLGALMGGYYGMMGGQLQGLGLGAYGGSSAGESGASGSMLQGLQYLYPNMQSGQSSSFLGNAAGGSGGSYSPLSLGGMAKKMDDQH